MKFLDIEYEIFKGSHVDLKKIIEYGFLKENHKYKYSKKFLNNNFRADVFVDENGNVYGKVYELEIDDEYTNIRVENSVGEFVNSVREGYKNILMDIKKNCFIKEYFVFEQSNRIAKYIINKYGDFPEFLWKNSPYCGVFRNENNKWYGIIMNVDKSKIYNSSGSVEILNIKINKNEISSLFNKRGFYPAYHMNKNNWITILLNDTLKDDEIFKLIDRSYNLVQKIKG